MRDRAITLVAILSLELVGCFSTMPKKKLVLPPAPVDAAKPAPLPEPEFVIPPPIETPPASDAFTEVTLGPDPPIEPAAPKLPPKRPRGPVTATTPAPPGPPTPEVEPPPTTPVPTAPQLSEILTDDRRRQYETDFSASVSRARTAVSRTNGRQLSTRQQETVERINTFLQQAEESKGKDLVTALQLARRADLLGQDLLRALQ
jgi:hypothetical protein